MNTKKVDCLSWSKLMSICLSSNSTPVDFSISILEVEKTNFQNYQPYRCGNKYFQNLLSIKSNL